MASDQSGNDDEVDFNKFRNGYESDDHWQLRKSFLIRHWDNFDKEDIIVRNAQLFMNIETLGCKYSNEVMHYIAKLANQVPEVHEYRKSRANSLKRSMVTAQSVIKAKYGKETDSKPKEEAPEVKIEIPESDPDWSSMEKAFWDMESRRNSNDFHLLRLTAQKRFENRRTLLKDAVVFDDIAGVFDINKTTACMNKIGKFEAKYDDETGNFLYIFNGEILAEGQADSKKHAKKIADRWLEVVLKGYCFAIRPKLAYFSPDEVIQRYNSGEQVTDNERLKEDNLGFRMLQALGWKGGTSLGTKNEGIIDPINLSIKVGRQGLGNDNPNFDRKYFENLLKNYKNNQLEYDLIFSHDFTKEERAQIHQIAQRHNLRTKSFGKGESRHLVISTKISPQVLRQKLLEGNSFFCEKYELHKPYIEKKKKKLL